MTPRSTLQGHRRHQVKRRPSKLQRDRGPSQGAQAGTSHETQEAEHQKVGQAFSSGPAHTGGRGSGVKVNTPPCKAPFPQHAGLTHMGDTPKGASEPHQEEDRPRSTNAQQEGRPLGHTALCPEAEEVLGWDAADRSLRKPSASKGRDD